MAKKNVKSTNKVSKASVGADRGIVLTVLLVLVGISTAFGLVGVLTGSASSANQVLPSWFSTYNIIALLISVAYIYGIWMWKKWGAYLLAIGIALGLIMQVMFTQTLTMMLPVSIGNSAIVGSLIGTLIVASIWYWAIARKWKYFK